MITPNQFSQLSLFERAAIVLEHGCSLMDRCNACYLIKLYQVEDFYVELWYRQNGNKIDKLEVVELENVIPYYERIIDINDLYCNC